MAQIDWQALSLSPGSRTEQVVVVVLLALIGGLAVYGLSL